MRVNIALAAEGFAKGDRVVVKAGKSEWYVGTIATSGVKLKIAFDDGATATVETADFKDVKHVDPKTKKLKKALTTVEAKALYTAGKPATTLKAAKEKVAAIKAAPAAKVTTPTAVVQNPKASTWPDCMVMLELRKFAAGKGFVLGKVIQRKRLPLFYIYTSYKDIRGMLGKYADMKLKGKVNNTGLGATEFFGSGISVLIQSEDKGQDGVYSLAINDSPKAESAKVPKAKAEKGSKKLDTAAVVKKLALPFGDKTGGFFNKTSYMYYGSRAEGPKIVTDIAKLLDAGACGMKRTTAPLSAGVTEAKYENGTCVAVLTNLRQFGGKNSYTINVVDKAQMLDKAAGIVKRAKAYDMSKLPLDVPVVGFVINLSGKEYVVHEIQQGRTITQVMLYNLATSTTATWKLRGYGANGRFSYARQATKDEIDAAAGKKAAHTAALDARANKNVEQGNALGIRIGDIVVVNYRDVGQRAEIVTDINAKTGKVAIATWRDLRNKKRRFIHMANVTSIKTPGPGYYDPNNAMYLNK